MAGRLSRELPTPELREVCMPGTWAADMLHKQLQGKTAIITGGAGGIGRATALLFAREGAALAIVDLKQAAGVEIAGKISAAGGHAIFERADLTRPDECQRVVDCTVKEFGGVHVLFNNAGIIRRASVLDVTADEWDEVMAVNVKSVLLMSRVVIPGGAQGGRGRVAKLGPARGW